MTQRMKKYAIYSTIFAASILLISILFHGRYKNSELKPDLQIDSTRKADNSDNFNPNSIEMSKNQIELSPTPKATQKTVGYLEYDDDWCHYSQLSPNAKKQRRTDINQWREHRGYFDRSLRENYRSYSEKTLKNLGQQGDLLALDSLYLKTAAKQESTWAEIEKILRSSAELGSSKAITSLGTHHSVMSQKNSDDLSQRTKQVIEALTYYFTAATLGDFNGFQLGMELLSKEQQLLTESDLSKINKRSKEYISKIDRIRNTNGLEAINTRPPRAISIRNEYKLSKLNIVDDSKLPMEWARLLIQSGTCSGKLESNQPNQ